MSGPGAGDDDLALGGLEWANFSILEGQSYKSLMSYQCLNVCTFTIHNEKLILSQLESTMFNDETNIKRDEIVEKTY